MTYLYHARHFIDHSLHVHPHRSSCPQDPVHHSSALWHITDDSCSAQYLLTLLPHHYLLTLQLCQLLLQLMSWHTLASLHSHKLIKTVTIVTMVQYHSSNTQHLDEYCLLQCQYLCSLLCDHHCVFCLSCSTIVYCHRCPPILQEPHSSVSFTDARLYREHHARLDGAYKKYNIDCWFCSELTNRR